MTSTFKFFPISVFAHLLFVFGISLFIAKPDNQPMEYGRKLIILTPVFGSYSSGSKSIEEKVITFSKQATPSLKKNQNNNEQSFAASSGAGTAEYVNTGASAAGSGSGAGVEGGDFEFSGSIVNYAEPIYPRMAIARGIEGNLKVKIKISPEGNSLETIILKSSGSEILDTAAVNAIKKWVFVKREIKTFYFVEKTIVFQIKK